MANSLRILVAEAAGFSVAAAEQLQNVGEVVLADLDRRELLLALREADVLWVRLRHRIDVEVLRAAPRLRVIVTATTGLNHIDLEEAARRGIRVFSLARETAFLQTVRATAEHTVALMLALLRHLPAAAAHVRAGGWNRDLYKGGELCARTVGIVGFGRLGRLVAGYLQAFGATVLAADPKISDEMPPGVVRLSLPDLLRESGIVSLHVSLSEETNGFFGRGSFAAMPRESYFVNTARGELVDEDALLEALQTGRLAGAALDVLSAERSAGMRRHPLVRYARRHGNLIITPHIGGCTMESMLKTELFLARKLAAELASPAPSPSPLASAGAQA